MSAGARQETITTAPTMQAKACVATQQDRRGRPQLRESGDRITAKTPSERKSVITKK